MLITIKIYLTIKPKRHIILLALKYSVTYKENKIDSFELYYLRFLSQQGIKPAIVNGSGRVGNCATSYIGKKVILIRRLIHVF